MERIDYLLLDQKIAELEKSVRANILSYVNPLNLSEQKERFFEELKKRNEYNPHFSYLLKNPLYSYFSMQPTFETYKNELRQFLNDFGMDSLGILFEKKALDLIETVELIKSIGTPNFPNNSGEVFGQVSKNLFKQAKEFAEQKVKNSGKKISFEEAKKVIQNFLSLHKLKYSIETRDEAGSMFSVNLNSKTIAINKNAKLTRAVLERLIAHEIETHIYRFENGLRQPYALLSNGTSQGTLETEEGLAVVVEKKHNIDVKPQLKNYAGRVLAISFASRNSFYKTFEKLTSYFDDEEAFSLTVRAKRGVYKQSEPGAFTKDLLYFKGMLTVEEFLKEHKMNELFYGRYAAEDAPFVFDIAGLKEPKFLPDFGRGKNLK